MERIIPPIRPTNHGSSVANFQQAMLFIAEMRQLSPGNTPLVEWRQRLKEEMAADTFGGRTKQLFDSLVATPELHIPANPFVNHLVAEAMNHLLDELGAFDGA